MAEAATGLYVYCVLPSDAQPALDEVRGVDERHAVRTVRDGDIAAVASEVSMAEFGAEPLKRNLNDLQWLERIARAHQRVLDRALASGTIVPLRLCTVFSDEAGVRAMLERDREVLTSALARLAGRQEWGLRVLADARLVRDAARRRPEAAAPEAGSGHAYVARLRRDRAARDDAQRIAREAARAIHQGLVEQAVGARILRKPTRELAADADELVLNGAYLVDTDRASEFRALADELGKRHCPEGMRLEITGPWPPFSFMAEPTDERRRSRADVR